MVAVVIFDSVLMASGAKDIEKAGSGGGNWPAHLAGPWSRVKGVTSTAS
jgi:hypothetical protein